MSDADQQRAQFEKDGVLKVRMFLEGHRYNHLVGLEAIKWLAEKDAEAHSRDEASNAEQTEFARATRDAAVASNALAEEANAVAREANAIAREASASAALSAKAAQTNNIIAIAALVIAAIAMIISIWGR